MAEQPVTPTLRPGDTYTGHVLSDAQAMTVRCAVETFAVSLTLNGLGDNKLGRDICAGYLARIAEIRQFLHVGEVAGGEAVGVGEGGL